MARRSGGVITRGPRKSCFEVMEPGAISRSGTPQALSRHGPPMGPGGRQLAVMLDKRGRVQAFFRPE